LTDNEKQTIAWNELFTFSLFKNIVERLKFRKKRSKDIRPKKIEDWQQNENLKSYI